MRLKRVINKITDADRLTVACAVKVYSTVRCVTSDVHSKPVGSPLPRNKPEINEGKLEEKLQHKKS